MGCEHTEQTTNKVTLAIKILLSLLTGQYPHHPGSKSYPPLTSNSLLWKMWSTSVKLCRVNICIKQKYFKDSTLDSSTFRRCFLSALSWYPSSTLVLLWMATMTICDHHECRSARSFHHLSRRHSNSQMHTPQHFRTLSYRDVTT